MFKNHLLGFSLLAVISTSAQITITSADLPNAGDSIRVSVTNSTGGTDQTLTGAGFSWDFSTLAPDVQRFEKFDNPSTFPSPYNFLFNPVNTSYGINNYQDTGAVVPGFKIDAAYDFFKESMVNFAQIGASYTINGSPIPFMYQKKDTLYEFPMNYLNVDSCDYKYGLSIPAFGYYGQKGHRVNVIDGWGSLTTPFGIFSVLRLKSTVNAVDSIYSTAFGFGTNVPRPLRIEYKWLATGMKIPVLYIEENAGLVTNVLYQDSLRAGVPQVGITENPIASDFSIYPNPTSADIFIAFNLAASSNVKITILNSIGRLSAIVANENFGEGKQTVMFNADRLNLVPGIYFVNLESNKGRSIKKVVVTE